MRRFDPRPLVLPVLLAAILGGTLWPEHGPPYPVSWCIACGERGAADAIRNLLLFIPLGFAASPRFRRAVWAIAACAALSLLVETLQQWIPGRDPSVSDLLLNSAGALLGVGLARSLRAWLAPAPHTAAWLCTGWATLLWGLFAGTGALLAPLPPPSPRPGPTAAAFIRELFAGNAVLQGTATHGDGARVAFPALPRGAGDFFRVSSEGDDLVLTVHTRAAAAQLDEPSVRWRGALAGVAQGSVGVGIRRREGGWCMRAGTRQRCGLGPTVGSGWGMIFFPDAAARHFGAWIDAAWVMALFAPLGLWLRRGGWGSAMAVLAGLAALAVLPALGVLAPTPLLQWLGAAIGVGTGALVAVRTGAARERSMAAVVSPPRRQPLVSSA